MIPQKALIVPATNDLPIISRYALRDDLAEILRLYMAALDEIKTHIEPPDLDRCADTVFNSWLHAPCVLLEKSNEIIGFAGLRTYRPTHTLQSILTEYMFYIKPAYRSIKAAKMLSDGVQAVADKFGLKLRMSHMVFDTPLAVKEKFLRRWGYNVDALAVSYGGA